MIIKLKFDDIINIIINKLKIKDFSIFDLYINQDNSIIENSTIYNLNLNNDLIIKICIQFKITGVKSMVYLDKEDLDKYNRLNKLKYLTDGN